MGRMILLLKPSDDKQKSLAAFMDQLHDRKSPLYHQWLTPDEYGQRFGVADADVQALTTWLQSKGFKIEDAPPSRNVIVLSGTAGQMRQAFHAEIHSFNVNGERHGSCQKQSDKQCVETCRWRDQQSESARLQRL